MSIKTIKQILNQNDKKAKKFLPNNLKILRFELRNNLKFKTTKDCRPTTYYISAKAGPKLLHIKASKEQRADQSTSQQCKLCAHEVSLRQSGQFFHRQSIVFNRHDIARG